MSNIKVISNLDDNTKLISIYKNDVDGHPVIGYAYAYLTLTAFEKLPILLAAQEVIFEELKEAYLELSVKVETPKREPLSDKEITKNTPKLIHIGERLAFHAGVRFAEKHHGIGGGEC